MSHHSLTIPHWNTHGTEQPKKQIDWLWTSMLVLKRQLSALPSCFCTMLCFHDNIQLLKPFLQQGVFSLTVNMDILGILSFIGNCHQAEQDAF